LLSRCEMVAIAPQVTPNPHTWPVPDMEIQNLATHLEPLVRGLQTGVLMVNADRTVLMANDALVSQLGVRARPADLVGMNAQDVLELRTRPVTDYRDIDVFIGDCVERGEPRYGVELPLGPEQTVEVDFIPISARGELLGRLWGIRNVTERAEVRRSLERRNEELSRLAALKTEFLATMSHELRTPLTALMGLTELVAAGAARGDDTIAEAVRRNVARMTALVETLLLLARLESRDLPLTVSRFDLSDLLRHEVADAMSTADSLSVHLRLDASTPANTDGDEKLLGQMLHHVLLSVISGAGQGATVNVRSETDTHADRWAAEITDRRPNAGTETLLFTRSPHPDRGGPAIGSGLGIALARTIAERHGGTVTVKPSDGGDHVIRVELPLGGVLEQETGAPL
jgi:signal transduction histidine kinase